MSPSPGAMRIVPTLATMSPTTTRPRALLEEAHVTRRMPGRVEHAPRLVARAFEDDVVAVREPPGDERRASPARAARRSARAPTPARRARARARRGRRRDPGDDASRRSRRACGPAIRARAPSRSRRAARPRRASRARRARRRVRRARSCSCASRAGASASAQERARASSKSRADASSDHAPWRRAQTRSTIIASASPPPMQIDARPRFLFACLRAWSSVVTMRAPLAPIG